MCVLIEEMPLTTVIWAHH